MTTGYNHIYDDIAFIWHFIADIIWDLTLWNYNSLIINDFEYTFCDQTDILQNDRILGKSRGTSSEWLQLDNILQNEELNNDCRHLGTLLLHGLTLIPA